MKREGVIKPVSTKPIRGYVEGYYGRLLDWSDRYRLLLKLSELKLNTYFYAPKEDVYHRLNWRDDYSVEWRRGFQGFCNQARENNITVLVGVAPGLDFNFSETNGNDFKVLLNKAKNHLLDGADYVVLCMDDIDEDFHQRSGAFTKEGEAHATLANKLSEALGKPVFVVPRVYSNDIAVDSPAYPKDFACAINPEHPVFLCGSDIVAQSIAAADFEPYTHHMSNRVIVWDNLYANDYCPRKLFVGPWTGREEAQDVLLNPTGLIETDLLLLSLMAQSTTDNEAHAVWNRILATHQIPSQFHAIAKYFNHPPFTNDKSDNTTVVSSETFEALEFLLWKWKTPLSREWYRYFMELKQDLLLLTGELPPVRILKTQTGPMATRLLKNG